MNKESKKNSSVIIVSLGSTAVKVVKAARALYESFPGTEYHWPKVIGFDGQNVDHTVCMPTVDKALENAKLMPHEIISADIGDKQSRKKAEDEGLLWSLPHDFPINPGAAAENVGVGGDARIGYGLFRLNENRFESKIEGAMRECLDYQLKDLPANMDGKFGEKPVIVVYMINTLAGGTGSSSYARAMTVIKRLGDERGVDLKITLLSAVIGTLNPGNKPQAAINQQAALKNILARMEYGFTDPDQTDGDLRSVCNPPIFMSNANSYGELANLDRTVAKMAYVLYLLVLTRFAAIARQECVDQFRNTAVDQYGTRGKGATVGLSNISFTRPKLIDSAAFDYGQNLIDHILCRDKTTDIEKTVDVLMSNLSLKETYTQAMTVDRVLSSQKSAYSAVDRVTSVFRERCGRRWGFAGCRDIMYASNYARQNELNGRIIHAVEDNTDNWLKTIIAALNEEIEGYLEKMNGFSLSRQVLEKMSESLAELVRKNDQGLFIARNNDKAIKSNLKYYEGIYQKLAKRFWLFRAMSFADKGEFRKNYPAIVESDIRNTLQIHARTLLKKLVFPQIRVIIATLLDYVGRMESKAAELGTHYADNVTRLANLPTYLYDAGGYELINQKLVCENVNRFYDGLGGRQNAAGKAFELFIKEFKSLDAFLKTETGNIGKFIKRVGAVSAKTFFANVTAYDVFNEAFPTDRQKTEIVGSIIERSCMSIKITGEGDENIPKVKYICGNDARLVNWAVKKANEIDRKGGDWKGHTDENLPDGLSFFQYRTKVSIAQLMKDTSAIAKLPSDLSELVQLGESPIISVMPDPGSKIDMVIAQGLAVGAIVCNGDDFEFHEPLEEPKAIGKTIEDVRKRVAGNYDHVAYICPRFAKGLYDNSSEVVGHLKNGNKLLQQLDKKAAQDALTVASLLIPYLKRIKKDNNGSVS